MSTQLRADVQSSDWIEKLARLGFLAKGAVYFLIGVLAGLAAWGAGGQTTGSKGALETIQNQPFGQVLLAITAVGLFGYALWRFVQSISDADDKGRDFKGLVARTGFFLSGLAHVALGLGAIQMVLGWGGSGGNSTGSRTATLMSQPYGRWLVAILGLLVIGVGIYQLYKAYSTDFKQHLALHELSAKARKWVIRFGRAGLSARGVVFFIIGGFLVYAAYSANPQQAKGFGSAIQTLERQAFGPFLLGAVALGLVAYGIFQWVQSRYRRIG